MKKDISPCVQCIVLAMCVKNCTLEFDYRADLGHRLDKQHPLIFTVNKHRRKHVKDTTRKHWNHLVERWNQHVDIYNRRIEKLEERSPF